jgi:hypothetical protein
VEPIVNVWYHIITKHAGGTNQQRNLASLALQAIAIYTGTRSFLDLCSLLFRSKEMMTQTLLEVYDSNISKKC